MERNLNPLACFTDLTKEDEENEKCIRISALTAKVSGPATGSEG